MTKNDQVHVSKAPCKVQCDEKAWKGKRQMSVQVTLSKGVGSLSGVPRGRLGSFRR